MIISVKLPLLFLATAILVSALSCRQAEVAQPQATPPPHTEQLPFDLAEMPKRYEAVKNYTAIYEKEERTISKGAKAKIKLAFRKPFAVRMEWLNDKGKIDQTAAYEEGKNDGNIMFKEGGLTGSLVGTLHIKPDSALAREDSRYPITRTGIGDLI